MHTLELDHVTKRYGSSVVVDDLSFTVRPGRVTGFLGPNGAGKSTLMKVLLGLARADAGTATIGGSPYASYSDPIASIGVLLEANAFHPARTGRNHLRVLADAAGVAAGRIDELLRLVGLSEAADRRVGAYSLGMRQRLGIAAALLGDPPVLVLDEPGNGLDPQGIRWLRDLLRLRAANGNTVFVSSHLLSEVEHLADDVVVINRGKLVAEGAIQALQHRTTVVRTPAPDLLTDVLLGAGATVRPSDGALLVGGLPTAEIGDRAQAAGIALHELAPSSGSLEELFLGWTETSDTHHEDTREVMAL
jgi:ABC-2 type transport system ATP-binding protein